MALSTGQRFMRWRALSSLRTTEARCVRNSRKNNLKAVFCLLELFVYIQLVTCRRLSSNAKFGNAQLELVCIETPPVSFICPFRRRQAMLKKAQLHNATGIFLGILDTKKFFRKSQEYERKNDKFENFNSPLYSRILNSSLNTHLTFWQHFTGKNVEKRI